jgi:hypothetical protein
VGASSANASMTIALYIKKHATISNQLKHKKHHTKIKIKILTFIFLVKAINIPQLTLFFPS